MVPGVHLIRTRSEWRYCGGEDMVSFVSNDKKVHFGGSIEKTREYISSWYQNLTSWDMTFTIFYSTMFLNRNMSTLTWSRANCESFLKLLKALTACYLPPNRFICYWHVGTWFKGLIYDPSIPRGSCDKESYSSGLLVVDWHILTFKTRGYWKICVLKILYCGIKNIIDIWDILFLSIHFVPVLFTVLLSEIF